MNEKTVVILSGGLDSTVLAADAASRMGLGDELHLISFDYGQRHRRELESAHFVALELKAAVHQTVNLRCLGSLIAGSTSLLAGGEEVPEGHYEAESMKSTVVPNRNMVMLSIAYSYALSVDAERLLYAAHRGDHAIYPDCRPEFVAALQMAMRTGSKWKMSDKVPELGAPFLGMSKAEIVEVGHKVNAPMHLTWSCYKGETKHCGRCGTCVERREAFKLARVEDPTDYEVA